MTSDIIQPGPAGSTVHTDSQTHERVGLSNCFGSCTRQSRGNGICYVWSQQNINININTPHNVHKATLLIQSNAKNKQSFFSGQPEPEAAVTNSNGSYFRVYLHSDICIFNTSRGICQCLLSTLSLDLHSKRKYQ